MYIKDYHLRISQSSDLLTYGTFSPAGTLGMMEGEVKKKKSKKSIGELHQEMSFKIEPSEAPAKVLDTSEWPLLLKVNILCFYVAKGLISVCSK